MSNLGNDHLIVNIVGNVMSVTLNRPEALNAFTPSMISGLIEAIKAAKENDEVRVVTLSGSGRAFSAGGDVKAMDKSPSTTDEKIRRINELILAMRNLEKPIIAIVHGYAAGAGFNLALASDLILAAEKTKFIASFSRVGLISDGGGLFFLPKLIGPYRAKELFFTAEPIDAEKAYHLGFVNCLYPLENFQKEAMNYAQKLAKGPGKAYGFIKKIANQSLVSDLNEILEQERMAQPILVITEDHREGVNAFKEKREPQFRGK